MKEVLIICLIAFLVVIFQILYAAYFFLKAGNLTKQTYVGEFNLGKGEQFEFFVAGDSVGAGVGASSFETSVVGRITGELSKNRSVHLVNSSVSGFKMKDLTKVQQPAKKQDLIVLIIGSNDLFHFSDLKQFEQSTKKVLELYSSLTDRLIIIGPGRIFDSRAIPPVAKLVYKLRSNDYSKIIAGETLKYPNVVYINPLTTSLNRDEYGDTNATDNFHPNDEGHRFWFDLIRTSL